MQVAKYQRSQYWQNMQNSLICRIRWFTIYALLTDQYMQVAKYQRSQDWHNVQNSLICMIRWFTGYAWLTELTHRAQYIYKQQSARDPMITRFDTICRVRWCARFTDLQDFLIHRICRICWFAGFADPQDMLYWQNWHKGLKIHKLLSTQDPRIDTICRIRWFTGYALLTDQYMQVAKYQRSQYWQNMQNSLICRIRWFTGYAWPTELTHRAEYT